ncbi:hypothetical protein CHS0354_025056 [Potamilus streckersoni]|uniref:Uncharacterized protein n=1 Tax=Potamilus streckersoni TaxID=2493646 RepID=A0AAE0T9Q7_9BIVA|nr:hypothetical protein CHS0354_025056 [Potamilus streckersoni]
MRDIGTSPMTSPIKEKSPAPSARRRISSSPSQASRQLKALKQRIGYLQQQVITLRDSRSAALKSLEEHKAANAQLQSDLNLANQRLRVSKQSFQDLFLAISEFLFGTCCQSSNELLIEQKYGFHSNHMKIIILLISHQKLNMEIEKIQKERLDLESKLAMKNEVSVTHGSDQHTEQDWKIMETRLKVSANEFSRQTSLVRQLKQDNEVSQEQVKTLQEKVSRLERDNNQKRTLLEDQRTRLRLAQDNAKSDANSLEERETKVKLLQDNIEKMKVQIESYKKRLGAVTREKRDYEERFLKLTADIEKKEFSDHLSSIHPHIQFTSKQEENGKLPLLEMCKHSHQLMECQNKKMELESSLTELEKTAQQQLKGLAHHSEVAIDTAQQKLAEAHAKIHMHQMFIKALGQEVLRKLHKARSVAREMQKSKEKTVDVSKGNNSLQRAQNLAKNILNLSQSDLEDIMSADGEASKPEPGIETEKRHDKKWTKKCERLISSKEIGKVRFRKSRTFSISSGRRSSKSSGDPGPVHHSQALGMQPETHQEQFAIPKAL